MANSPLPLRGVFASPSLPLLLSVGLPLFSKLSSVPGKGGGRLDSQHQKPVPSLSPNISSLRLA